MEDEMEKIARELDEGEGEEGSLSLEVETWDGTESGEGGEGRNVKVETEVEPSGAEAAADTDAATGAKEAAAPVKIIGGNEKGEENLVRKQEGSHIKLTPDFQEGYCDVCQEDARVRLILKYVNGKLSRQVGICEKCAKDHPNDHVDRILAEYGKAPPPKAEETETSVLEPSTSVANITTELEEDTTAG